MVLKKLNIVKIDNEIMKFVMLRGSLLADVAVLLVGFPVTAQQCVLFLTDYWFLHLNCLYNNVTGWLGASWDIRAVQSFEPATFWNPTVLFFSFILCKVAVLYFAFPAAGPAGSASRSFHSTKNSLIARHK